MNVETKQLPANSVCGRVHPRCIVCGSVNTRGLHLNFEVHDDGSVKALFECNEIFEGYPRDG